MESASRSDVFIYFLILFYFQLCCFLLGLPLSPLTRLFEDSSSAVGFASEARGGNGCFALAGSPTGVHPPDTAAASETPCRERLHILANGFRFLRGGCLQTSTWTQRVHLSAICLSPPRLHTLVSGLCYTDCLQLVPSESGAKRPHYVHGAPRCVFDYFVLEREAFLDTFEQPD